MTSWCVNGAYHLFPPKIEKKCEKRAKKGMTVLWKMQADSAKWSEWSLPAPSQADSRGFLNICDKTGTLPLWVFSETHGLSLIMRKAPDKLKLVDSPQRYLTVVKTLRVIETKSEARLQQCQISFWVIKGMSGKKQGSQSRVWHLVNNWWALIH